ncbi:hypothetical protein [Flavobacterium sp.]|uniref:hypothetical protein n=1 Tax=Flavobacterium sp. TaxID=239 RepID=UPI00378DD3A1
MFLKKSQESRAKSQAPRAKKQYLYSCLLPFAFCLFSFSANAQCAMCRAALAGEGNVAKAQAVNNGIVYLMVIPYLLIAGVFYAIYRMRKNK